MADDYCDLCDLPRSQCIHGMPAPAPKASPPPRTASTTVRRTTRSAAAGSAPATPVRRRWTPPEALRPHIIAVLQDAGGELEQEQVFVALEERLADQLLAGDQETTPEGELRWRYAARRARQALVGDGLMGKGRPGVWELTAAGRRA